MKDRGNGITLCYYHHKNWLVKASREDIDKFYESITDYDYLKQKANQIIKFNLDYCIREFKRLMNYCVNMNIDTSKVVPRYIVKELLPEWYPTKEMLKDYEEVK
jgi:hypothetical protein